MKIKKLRKTQERKYSTEKREGKKVRSVKCRAAEVFPPLWQRIQVRRDTRLRDPGTKEQTNHLFLNTNAERNQRKVC